MPAPLYAAAAAAARLISKKLAQRAAGGITGAGSKSVNPIYKEVGPSVKVVAKDPTRQAKFNQGSLMKTTDAKTGAAAKKGAKATGVTGKKGVQPPIKINSK
jgi:hypothetical protein